MKAVYSSKIPDRSGVYVAAHCRRIASLPMELSPIYIGKGKNLRARFNSHLDPSVSHNDGFSQRLINATEDNPIDFWFVELPELEISEFEKRLIRELDPEENIIRYGEPNT